MINVRLESSELNKGITASLTGPAITVVHDVEGWQAVQRFARTSITEYQGSQQLEMQLPCLFDGKFEQRSQETNVKTLEDFGTFIPDKRRTPLCQFDAQGRVPHDKTRDPHIQWVIQALDFSAGYMLDETLRFRVRQEFTVTFWQYSVDQIYADKLHPPLKKIPKTYVIKKKDTLQKIAAFFYGDQARWKDIAQLNKIHNPLKLRVGKRIKLPKA